MASTEPSEKIYRSKKDIIINNFLGGIAWGIGGTMGLAIVLLILGFVVSNANLVPIIGDFVLELSDYILQRNPQLVK